MRQLPTVDTQYLIDLPSLERRRDGTVDWSKVYGAERLLRVEVGIGNSPFLLDVRHLEPDFSYLGLEYMKKRVLKFLLRVNASGVGNVRVAREGAEVVLRNGIAAGELDHLFVNFPDPWPKRRHAKNRFVQPRTIADVLKSLRVGGGLSLKTDSPHYASQMLRVLDEFSPLENLSGRGRFSCEPRYPFPTPFELQFRQRGLRVYHLEYTRVSE